MKKALFVALIALLFIAPVAAEEKTTSILNDSNIVLEGDTLYNFKDGRFMVGFGFPIVTAYKGMIELRGEIATDFSGSSLAGAGFGVDVFKVVSRFMPDIDWVVNLKPKIGIAAMADFSNPIKRLRDITPVSYVNLIRKEF